MNTEKVGNSWKIAAPYPSALKLIRGALLGQNLHIATEFDACDIANGSRIKVGTPCRILCVDSPLLLLKAMTLDPAAAVFLPLHLVVYADGPETQIYWLNLENVHGRLPAGSIPPLRALQARILMAMEALPASNMNDLEVSHDR